MPQMDEWWIGQLPKSIVPGEIECPNCFGIMFTAKEKPYGIELACLKCPTYIGVPTSRDQLTVWSGPRHGKRKLAGRAGRFRLLGWLHP